MKPPMTKAMVDLAIRAGNDSADLDMCRDALRRMVTLAEMARRALVDDDAEMRRAFLDRVDADQFFAEFVRTSHG